MCKNLFTVIALGLAFLNIASAGYQKVVDLTPYLVASSSDTSKVLTLKPNIIYNLPTTTTDGQYYVVVQCPEPKSTKLTKGLVSTFNAPGNAGSGVYRRVDIYDINGGWVQYVYNSYYFNVNLVSCVGGVLGSMYND